MTGYDNVLTMTAVVEDGARERQYERCVNYSMGEHTLWHRYIHDDVMSTRFKLNRPIK